MAIPSRVGSAMFALLVVGAGCTGPDRREGASPRPSMMIPSKLGASMNIPWEKEFGTMASVQARDAIFLAAQLSWDEQGAVKGDTVEAQMRQAYANIAKLLERHGAKMTDIVEETLFVVDVRAAVAAAPKVRREVFGEDPVIASSIVEVKRLADPKALLAIKVTARLDTPMGRGTTRGDDSEPRSRGGGSRGRGMGGGMGGRGIGGGGGYGGPSPY